VALTLAELEAQFPGGPSVAYRAAAERARVVLAGELGGVVAAVLESYATVRDGECRDRRLKSTSWLISAGAPNALSAVLLEPKEELMDNQHKMISGYRDLSQAEIDAINLVKSAEVQLGQLWLQVTDMAADDRGVDMRWANIAKTHFEEGFSALVRSIAKPEPRF
jgi:hypothetical protein